MPSTTSTSSPASRAAAKRVALRLLALLLLGSSVVQADDALTQAAAPYTADAACPVETTITAPEDYFPPGSRRRMESGEVVIEFTTVAGLANARDVMLVKGSGFEDLDRAALKLGRALAVSTSCGAQRVRRSIVFEVWRDPRDKPEHLGCLIIDKAVLTVEIFPYNGP